MPVTIYAQLICDACLKSVPIEAEIKTEPVPCLSLKDKPPPGWVVEQLGDKGFFVTCATCKRR